jgi:hypothetical protein
MVELDDKGCLTEHDAKCKRCKERKNMELDRREKIFTLFVLLSRMDDDDLTRNVCKSEDEGYPFFGLTPPMVYGMVQRNYDKIDVVNIKELEVADKKLEDCRKTKSGEFKFDITLDGKVTELTYVL